MTDQPHARSRGFTLTELLIVIAIIVILIGILIPVVSVIQRRARGADTQAFIAQLQTAVEAYYQDHRAYPGPLTNDQVYATLGGTPPTIAGLPAGAGGTANITGTENLLLGLMGGLYYDITADALTYDPDRIGRGPGGLNPQAPKTWSAYLQTSSISEGSFSDDAGAAADSPIPEFVDRFPSPLPVLYLRARVGQTGDVTAGTRAGPYDIVHIFGYTSTSIGEGKNLPLYWTGTTSTPREQVNPWPGHGLQTATATATMVEGTAGYTLPYDAVPYFRNPSMPGTPRQKDRYILISAGEDRVYGTDDDITNFGSVIP